MRGLLMVECLYHQTIKGLKTQTRRESGLEIVNDTTQEMAGHMRSADDWRLDKIYWVEDKNGLKIFNQGFKTNRERSPYTDPITFCKARYKVGEVLYLKEPYIKLVHPAGDYGYQFGAKGPTGIATRNGDTCTPSGNVTAQPKWLNKLFMPADAGREFIKITGIHCDRLLDISEEDCIAEGIEHPINFESSISINNCYWRDYLAPIKTGPSGAVYEQNAYMSKQKSFFSLFRFANKISPKKNIGNPWVFAYTFEYLKNYKP